MEIRKKYGKQETVDRICNESEATPITEAAKQAIIDSVGHPDITVGRINDYARGMVIGWGAALCQQLLDVAQDAIEKVTGEEQHTFAPVYERRSPAA